MGGWAEFPGEDGWTMISGWTWMGGYSSLRFASWKWLLHVVALGVQICFCRLLFQVPVIIEFERDLIDYAPLVMGCGGPLGPDVANTWPVFLIGRRGG